MNYIDLFCKKHILLFKSIQFDPIGGVGRSRSRNLWFLIVFMILMKLKLFFYNKHEIISMLEFLKQE